MFTRIKRKKYRVFAFDIESHNDEESIAKGETSMWLGCLIDETSTMNDDVFFSTMDEFIDRLEELSSVKRGKKKGKNDARPCNNLIIYCYNTSFEWSFILPVLLKRGFTFSTDAKQEYTYNSVSTKSVSSVWQVNLHFGKHSGNIIIRDLAKMFGGGLGKVAKAFNLPTQKGEIDYTLNRHHGNDFKHDYDEVPWIATTEEREYCFKDVKIVMDILEHMKNDKDFWNVCSMASYSMLRLMRRGFPNTYKPYRKYRKDYPELGKEESEFLRHSVAGGITYATDMWQFIDIKQKMCHIDAHQMHPSQIASKLFPYGEGMYFTGEPSILFKHINCCHIVISYTGVKLHSCIQLIGVPMIQGREMWVWDFEIPTMYKCYENLEIEYIDGYCYKSKMLPWRFYVIENYDERMKAKQIKNEFFILFYKLLNNAGAYGKFLENPHNEVFANTINDLGVIDSEVINKEADEIRVNAKYTYLPVGSCIPAYSRVELVEKALLLCNYPDEDGITRFHPNVTYFDTDSIFFIWNEQTEKILYSKFDLQDHLGGWAIEEFIDRAMFTAPKRYKTETDGITTIKAGGINFTKYKANKVDEKISSYGLVVDEETRKQMILDYAIPFDEVNIISSEWQVQRAYRVKGGTLIEFQNKKMDVQKKYSDIYHKNARIKES